MRHTTDPLDSYNGIPKERISNWLGLLPYFIAETDLSSPENASEAFQTMEECYGLSRDNMLENGKGKVHEDGTYSHPGDADLQPYVKFELDGEAGIEILVYPFAFVVVRDADSAFMARFD